MSEQNLQHPVTFKQGEQIVFATQGSIEESKGEPFDTALVYSSAVKALKAAIKKGDAPKDAFKISDLVIIEYPDRKTRSFTDEQMGELLDEYYEAKKHKATRNSRIVVTLEGGFAGGFMKQPVDVTLDTLSEEDFQRVAQITDLLQTRRAPLEYYSGGGDFGYYVKIADRATPDDEMKYAFQGGPFSKTPKVVRELEDILSKYMQRSDKAAGQGRA